MPATLRLKQLLFIAAALALVSLGLVAALAPASPARADDTQPCVETQDSYTDWVNEGAATQTLANTPPGADTDTVRYLPAGTVQVGNGDAVEATPDHFENLSWFVWTGGPRDVAPGLDEDGWNGVPALPSGLPHDPVPGTVYNVAHGASGNGSWFKYDGTFVPGTQGQDETFHTEYLWQKQVRTFVPGNECPDPGPDCEETNTCPEPPCEETNTCPDEEKPPVCHPVEGNGELGNGWNLISPDQASSHIDEALFPNGEYWKHETSDGRHDMYSEDGETCPDAEEPPEECVPEDFNGDEPGCGEPDPGPNCDEDPHAEGCEEDDDPNCQEDPNQPGCDEDKPPVVVPDDGNTPNNHQSNNGPIVKGAQATAPTAVAPAAGTPAASVPTAVDAGLAPAQRDLTGTGGGLGLLGIATAFVGAALLGLTVRPRRRIGAASRART
jgi:hypothetical protein